MGTYLGAHIPWAQVDTYLDLALELQLVPEIAIKGPDLDLLDTRVIKRVAETLASHNFRPRVHAPFFDLNPGAIDWLIREATQKRLEQALAFAGELHADLMVIHPGVDKWRYPNLDQVWLENAAQFFQNMLEKAEQLSCRLAIENIYEENPANLVKLVDRLDSPWFGHCFDVGHWHLFGRLQMHDWLQHIEDKLFHLHLHDNHGRADEHLPVGSGTIDFAPLKALLERMESCPSITFEAHNPDHLKASLEQAKKRIFLAVEGLSEKS